MELRERIENSCYKKTINAGINTCAVTHTQEETHTLTLSQGQYSQWGINRVLFFNGVKLFLWTRRVNNKYIWDEDFKLLFHHQWAATQSSILGWDGHNWNFWWTMARRASSQNIMMSRHVDPWTLRWKLSSRVWHVRKHFARNVSKTLCSLERDRCEFKGALTINQRILTYSKWSPVPDLTTFDEGFAGTLCSQELDVQTYNREENIIWPKLLSVRRRQTSANQNAVKGPPCEQISATLTMRNFYVPISHGS